jgi:hypothetical protein
MTVPKSRRWSTPILLIHHTSRPPWPPRRNRRSCALPRVGRKQLHRRHRTSNRRRNHSGLIHPSNTSRGNRHAQRAVDRLPGRRTRFAIPVSRVVRRTHQHVPSGLSELRARGILASSTNDSCFDSRANLNFASRAELERYHSNSTKFGEVGKGACCK